MKWQLLHKACWAGDAGEVARLLAAGADPNQVAPTGWRQTPLGRTLEFRLTHPKHEGHWAVVRVLLERGADARVRSTYLDLTPYEQACFGGFQPAAELLRGFQAGAAAHPAAMPALWLAAASRLPAHTIGELSGSGNLNGIWRKATPLMMAAGHAGNFEVADALLEAGADPNAGTSILHAACEWHFEHLVPAIRYLARQGWGVNSRDADGQTALHKAALDGYVSGVRALLSLDADPDARDRTGATPLDLARRFNKPAAIKALTRAS